MPDFIKCFFKVNKVVIAVPLMRTMDFFKDATVEEDLCGLKSACSSAINFFKTRRENIGKLKLDTKMHFLKYDNHLEHLYFYSHTKIKDIKTERQKVFHENRTSFISQVKT